MNETVGTCAIAEDSFSAGATADTLQPQTPRSTHGRHRWRHAFFARFRRRKGPKRREDYEQPIASEDDVGLGVFYEQERSYWLATEGTGGAGNSRLEEVEQHSLHSSVDTEPEVDLLDSPVDKLSSQEGKGDERPVALKAICEELLQLRLDKKIDGSINTCTDCTQEDNNESNVHSNSNYVVDRNTNELVIEIGHKIEEDITVHTGIDNTETQNKDIETNNNLQEVDKVLVQSQPTDNYCEEATKQVEDVTEEPKQEPLTDSNKSASTTIIVSNIEQPVDESAPKQFKEDKDLATWLIAGDLPAEAVNLLTVFMEWQCTTIDKLIARRKKMQAIINAE